MICTFIPTWGPYPISIVYGQDVFVLVHSSPLLASESLSSPSKCHVRDASSFLLHIPAFATPRE